MSELKEHRFITTDELFHDANAGALYYDKSEADKAIAEKDKELRRQKYKRCLDKAEMCEAKYDAEDAKVNDGLSWEYISKEMKYYERWRNRWLKLADKFKEAK